MPGPASRRHPPASRHAATLLAWADARGLRHLLGTSAVGVLRRYDAAPPDLPFPHAHTVMQVLLEVDAVRRSWTVGWQQRLGFALERAVAMAALASGYAQRAEHRRSRPPSVAALRPLWQQLGLALRERGPAAPPTFSQLPPLPAVELRPTLPGLRWKAGPGACCMGEDGVLVERATVELVLAEGGFRLSCACAADHAPRCQAQSDLLALTLDLLTHPAGAAQAEALGAALETPPWQRGLNALDRMLVDLGLQPSTTALVPTPAAATPVRSAEDPAVAAWQLRTEDGGWWLCPTWAQPDASGGWTTWARPWPTAPEGRRLSAEALEDGVEVPVAARSWEALAVAPGPVLLDGRRVEIRPAALSLGWRAVPGGGLRITPVLDDRALSLDEVADLLAQPGAVAVLGDAARRILWVTSLAGGVAPLLQGLLHQGLDFPPPTVTPLLQRLHLLRQVLPIRVDPMLQGSRVQAAGLPVVQLTPMPEGRLHIAVCVRPLARGPAWPPGAGPVELYAEDDQGARLHFQRDLASEPGVVRAALGPLADTLGLGSDEGLADGVLNEEVGPFHRLHHHPDEALDAVLALQQAAGEGRVQVEWTRDAMKVGRPMQPDGLKVQVHNDRGWLAMGGTLEIDGLSVDVARLLELLRSGRRYLRLEDGTWAALADRLRRALQAVEVHTHEGADGDLHLSPLSGPALAELDELGVALAIPATLARQRDAWTEAQRMQPKPPPSLQATPHPHQREGIAWLQRLAHWSPGACLADDMGLGKTLQALALLLHRAPTGPALVVAPTSVAGNWLAEAERFAPSLDVRLFRGAHRALLLDDLRPGTVVVTSYTLLVRDQEALQAVNWGTVVFDEAHFLKNADAARTQAARGLKRAFTLGLTGTPLENRTGELWSLFSVLLPGLLGTRARFRQGFAEPIERDSCAEAGRRLSTLLAPFLLRRTKDAVAADLPDRSDHVLAVALSPAERRLYDAARQSAIEELQRPGKDRRFAVLRALTRLRQLSCHPRLVDPHSRVASAKLGGLRDLVGRLVQEGHRMLIFSQFTRHLDLARAALADVAPRQLDLRGSTPAALRASRVAAFQRGEADVFFLSLRAAGTGLNLTAATRVIHLDPWWNPAVEDQATDRAHRIGQDRPVEVYRLVAQDTVEDGILKLHADKRALASSVLAGAAGVPAPSLEELVALVAG